MSDTDKPGYSRYEPGYSGFGGPEYPELYPVSPGMSNLKGNYRNLSMKSRSS